jgi:chorismate mutase/prephenate dehydratase
MAAIGSQKASKLYDLAIIAGPINSNRTNTTRFVIIGKELKIDETCNKISIVLSTEHKAGRLYNVLRYFAENDINMFKIESRPIQNKPWEYYFYIDFEGNLEDAKVRSAIEAIKKNSLYFKILGHYKPHHGNAL